MSKAKFAAAKELIEEKNYEVARSVLETIDDPLAKQWLQKLDRIVPVFPVEARARVSTEQERYYRAQNRARHWRRVDNALKLIVASAILFAIFVLLLFLDPPSDLYPGIESLYVGMEIFLLPFSLLGLYAGIRSLRRRD